MGLLNSPLKIKGLTIPNRLARSATWEGLADNGMPSQSLEKILETLAAAGVGLIVGGMTKVSAGDPASPRTLDFTNPSIAEPLRKLVEAQRRHGAVAGIQLAHQGAAAYGGDPEVKPSGPSALEDARLKTSCREFSKVEIHGLVEDFARAAKLARDAGYQVLQLHCAHGYLLSQFLSPLFNRRGDQYGGSPMKRARLIFEILEAARGVCGDEAVFGVKINGADYMEGGVTPEESRAVVQELAAQGLDLVEVSGGLLQNDSAFGPLRSAPKGGGEGTPFVEVAAYFKEKLKIPVYAVNGVRRLATAEKILADKRADGLALSRPLVREPELARDWLFGRERKSACISCNACLKAAFKDPRGLHCPPAEALL